MIYLVICAALCNWTPQPDMRACQDAMERYDYRRTTNEVMCIRIMDAGVMREEARR